MYLAKGSAYEVYLEQKGSVVGLAKYLCVVSQAVTVSPFTGAVCVCCQLCVFRNILSRPSLTQHS